MTISPLAEPNIPGVTADSVASDTNDAVTAMPMRDPAVRLNDFYEVYQRPDASAAQREASRCMNCGAAFCMPEGGYVANDNRVAGCPISNQIPDWNRLVETGRWRDAYGRLALTNNFPEFTSRVCPAPCQDACIVGINDRPVGIKAIERAIIDRAFDEGWVRPRVPAHRSGRRVAVIGSGPAGLAAADELNAAGHTVTVLERADAPGGLLTYGIPSMKLGKGVVRRRLDLMREAGVMFRSSVDVGRDVSVSELWADYDAVVLAIGALSGRDLDLPGRELAGVTLAMPYLEAAARQRQQHRSIPASLEARGKHVVVIGGGDTGADCVATALRQGARSVVNITRRPQPPDVRDADHPWPGPPATYTLDYAHQEGLARHGNDPRNFGVRPRAFLSDSTGERVEALGVEAIVFSDSDSSSLPYGGAQEALPCDLCVLAIGFEHHDSPGLVHALRLTPADLALANPKPGLFIAGDVRRGPSLVVHAIAEGRRAARDVDAFLMSS